MSDSSPGFFARILRQDMESWAGCVAGALEEETYRALLQETGFVDVGVEVTRRYRVDDTAPSAASAVVAALSLERFVATPAGSW